jgi:hypothetical protein
MKIGIFGDSFADATPHGDIWWKYLQKDFGHNVQSFGEAGSSILYSATKLLEEKDNFEFFIWCVTSSNRLTVRHRANYKEISIHVTGRHHQTHSDPVIQSKINITEDYIDHVFDWPDGDFTANCVVEYVKSQIPNLLIIPCFLQEFNLMDLCQKENLTYFPNGESMADILDFYYDKRNGHLTNSTHIILAKLISHSLSPGIFKTDYSNFPAPVELFENVFGKK